MTDDDFQNDCVLPQQKTDDDKLVCFFGKNETLVIQKYPFKVGRKRVCDFVIEPHYLSDDNFCCISKEHFVLTKENEVVHITDTSKNGTVVNGQILNKNDTIALKNKSVIEVGSQKAFTFISDRLPDTLSDHEESNIENVPITKLPIWGRLISYRANLESIDLNSTTFKFGRSSECDLIVEQDKFNGCYLSVSKVHFIIQKDCENQVVYIKDNSKTGTYLNDILIGRGNMNILQTDDVISIGPRRILTFLYKRMYSQETITLPPQLQKKYESTRLLGKGASGEVRLCYEKCSCKMFAIKRILKGRSTSSQMNKMNHPTKIRCEITILKNLSHPFIIGMKEIIETRDEVFLVLDYMRGGELTNRILAMEPLTERNAKFLFYQIVLAVQYLHQKGITHRDLKAENVLLATEDVETLVKVSDFGLSKITEGNDMNTVCGTLQYIAPEILKSNLPYNKEVDIWSLGVILFYMLSRTLPFKSEEKAYLINLIKVGHYNIKTLDNVSNHAIDLVKKMLVVKPNERITIQKILKHPWLDMDIPIKNKIEVLLNQNIVSDEIPFSYNIPPTKRPRLTKSEESTM